MQCTSQLQAKAFTFVEHSDQRNSDDQEHNKGQKHRMLPTMPLPTSQTPSQRMTCQGTNITLVSACLLDQMNHKQQKLQLQRERNCACMANKYKKLSI